MVPSENNKASACSVNDVCEIPFNYVHNQNLTNSSAAFTVIHYMGVVTCLY